MMKTYVKNRVRTYLLITLIPLITSIAVYAVTFSALSSAIKKTEQSVFSAFTEYFEASLETAIEKTHKIVYGYDYISLDRSDVSLGVDDDKFTSVKEKLVAIKSETPFVTRVALPVSDGFFITDAGLDDKTYFADTISRLVGKSAEQLEKTYGEYSAEKIRLIDFGEYSAAILSVDYVADKKAVWIIDNGKLKKSVIDYFGYGNFVLSIGEIEITKGRPGENAFKNAIIGKSTGINYAMSIPGGEYSYIFIPLWIFFSASLVLSVALTAFLIVKNAKRGYKPIEKIAKKLNDGDVLSEKGEFDSIEKGIDKIIEQKRFAEEKAKSDRDAIIKGIAVINVEDVKAFFNLLKTKDFSEAGEKLKKFVLPMTDNVSESEVAARLLSLSGRLNAELDKATKNFKESFLQELDYKTLFSNALSKDDFISATDKVFSALQSYTDEYGVDKNDWTEAVKEYVEDNYTDANLTVAYLAEKFHFSLSHFSRSFKETTGESLSLYIDKVRINNAERLLEEGLSVEETATKTGFTDRGTFMRVFKKINGITPSRYKKRA